MLVWGESLLLCGAAADDGGLLELKLTCVVWGPVFTGLVASNFFLPLYGIGLWRQVKSSIAKFHAVVVFEDKRVGYREG